MKNNFVAKNAHKYCKATVMTDRKKDQKSGRTKHKQDYKNDRNGHF